MQHLEEMSTHEAFAKGKHADVKRGVWELFKFMARERAKASVWIRMDTSSHSCLE